MSLLGVQDTVAWRIVRELVDHSWGSDKEFDENEFLNLCSSFYENGGSWEGLMDGDMECISILENHLETIFAVKDLNGIATKISNYSPDKV